MRLVKFKIQNYKRIEETGWIDVGDVTALVGGNETGKTSVLQALWKLKPGRANITLDAFQEFPRRRLTDDYVRGGYWPVVSALFDIDVDTKAGLVAIDPAYEECEQVICTNCYDNSDVVVEFVPDVTLPYLSRESLTQLFVQVRDRFQTADNDLSMVEPILSQASIGENEEPEILASQLEVVQQFQDKVSSVTKEAIGRLNSDPREAAQFFHDQLNALMQHSWQHQVSGEVLAPIAAILQRPSAERRRREAEDLVWDAVPVFVYFDDYNLLESQIRIPEAIQSIASKSTDPKVRSQWALFEMAGFDIEEISKLAFQHGNPDAPLTQEAREVIFREAEKRSILASAAGRAITEKFIEWWHQHRHTIDFHVDGEIFQIEVEDEKYQVPIRFEQRSRGFRWFFTFYLVFTAETDRQHQNAVLLLDEPGLHLYKPAQEELLDFFDEVSRANQVIYSTHSPFMIDSSHLERVRLVEETEVGLVRISPDARSHDDNVVFPVEAAFLNQFAHLLFLSRRVLVVEGETDHLLLQYLSDCLSDEGRQGLPERIVIIAAKGNQSVHPLVALMVPHQFEVVVLLDSDEAGRNAGNRLTELGFVDEPVVELRFYGDILGHDDPFDLESMLPEDLYRQAVEETHGVSIPGHKVKVSKKNSYCVAVKKYMKDQGLEFDKGLPIEWIISKWREGDMPVPDEVLEQAEKVIQSIQDAIASIEG